ncbi:MAG TPA: RNA polymerase sigma factor [Candidatus Limnocylindrales bacterium]|nr:RNA polymerase sigma factor [Candidatus Limnocylindrales bacterium]
MEAFIVAAFEAHHAEVFAFLARSARDRALAEDLLRETYIGLRAGAGNQPQPAQVRGLLYRIAANLVIQRSRPQTSARRWPGRHRRRERGGIVAPSAEARGLLMEPRTDIERALDGLSVDGRVALLLSGEGFAGDEIAAAIARSGSATRSLLCLARARVRIRRDLFAAEGR